MPRNLVVTLGRWVAIATVVYVVYYLWWRATATLNWNALAFAIVLLAAEALDGMSFAFFVFQAWRHREEQPLAAAPGLHVDVFVPTFDEDLDILEATLTGCNAMQYPHTTYVLDDGRRPEVADLAESLGCRYLTRADNHHAKAGNINAALTRTHGDLIAVFDADMVPQPDFLDRTLGYFADEQVAVVQLPQEFYNVDSVQHAAGSRDGLWHEQSLFFRVIQPGRSYWNAAFWCGSPSIVRRAALEDVGGVATETVTEDIHTTIRMHSRGWKTVYHNDPLAFGLAPQTLHAFTVQRLRWAQGTLQLLRTRDNPLLVPGLTLAQRLNYLGSILHFTEGYQDLAYVITPIAVLLTGVWPLRVGGLEFIAYWLPFVALRSIVTIGFGRKHYRLVQVEQYSLLRMFTLIRASVVLLARGSLRFRVTPKRIASDVYTRERQHIAPHLGTAVLSIAAVSVGAYKLVDNINAGRPADMLLVAFTWAVVQCGLLISSMWMVVQRPHQRHDYRFRSKVMAFIGNSGVTIAAASTDDLSLYGCALSGSDVANSNVGDEIDVTLCLPAGLLRLHAKVTHRSVAPEGEPRLGVRFLDPGRLARRRLFEYLFITAARLQVPSLQPLGNPPEQAPAREALAA